MGSQTLLRVTIWVATAVCVGMLFFPLVRQLLATLGVSLESGGPP